MLRWFRIAELAETLKVQARLCLRDPANGTASVSRSQSKAFVALTHPEMRAYKGQVSWIYI